MAKNDISNAVAHLRMTGWTALHVKGNHYYTNGNYKYIRYAHGTWAGQTAIEEPIIDLLNDLTIRPNRYNHRKLILCENLIHAAKGVELYPNIFSVNNVRIHYYSSKNEWIATGFVCDKTNIEHILHRLNEIMSKPYGS